MAQLSFAEINEMSIRQINKYFRSIDESHKWPICGRFNVTERAIRRLVWKRRQGLVINPGLEYYLSLYNETLKIVNSY